MLFYFDGESELNNGFFQYCYQTMKTASEIKNELRQFNGTSQYYAHPFNICYTDGIKYMAEICSCYWLIDLVASWQTDSRVKVHEFQVYKLRVQEDKSAIVTIEDGNSNIIQSQKIEYTSFPLDEIDIWFCCGVLYLPSEH